MQAKISTSEMNSVPRPRPENVSNPRRVQLFFTGVDYKNMRSRATSDSPDIGDLFPGDIVTLFDPRLPDEKGVMRSWQWVEDTPRNQGAGYVATDGIKFLAVPADPDDTPVPPKVVDAPPVSVTKISDLPIDATPAPVFTVPFPVPQADPTNILELPPDAPASAPQPDSSAVATDIPKAQEAAENDANTRIVVSSFPDGRITIDIHPSNDHIAEMFMGLIKGIGVIAGSLAKWPEVESNININMSKEIKL